MKKTVAIIVLAMLVFSCKTNKQISNEMKITSNNPKSEADKQTIVYKTTKDFSDYIPVIMNAERTKIVSYPAPSDLSLKSKPTKLKNDYWLDNRGITENVVFLNYTYEGYIAMTVAPSIDEMLKNIKDKYPLQELIFCGSSYQYKNEIEELNDLIEKGFTGCKKAVVIPLLIDTEK